ncbi:MAG: hypothetical protein U0271_41110 [Polyangiaceae bacterium]
MTLASDAGTFSPTRFLPWVAAFVGLFACTNDFDQFNFSSGGSSTGGSTTTGTGASSTGGSGGNPTTGGTGGMGTTTSSSTGGMSVGGAGGAGGTGVGGTGGTGVGGTGGTGGGGPTHTVPCGVGITCDLDAGEVCCFNDQSQNLSCKTNGCNGQEVPLACDDPTDCSNGDICCELTSGGGPNATLFGTECRTAADCQLPDNLHACDLDLGDTCPPNQTCGDSQIMPPGYERCL